MPQLGRFVRISYKTAGPAAHAMRTLNAHLRTVVMQEGEAEKRVRDFLAPAPRTIQYVEPIGKDGLQLPQVEEELWG